MADSTHTPDAESTESAPTTPARRRTRRAAGAPAGAPSTAPEQTGTPAADSESAPRTSVPAQSTSVPEQSAAEPAAPTRRRRRAAGAPAGAPTVPAPAADPAPEPAAEAEETAEAADAPSPADDAAEQTAADEQTAAEEADEQAEEADEQAEELDEATSSVVDDLRALATARGASAAEEAEEIKRREQAQLDFASLLFRAPAAEQPRTTVGAGDAPVGSADLSFEAGAPVLPEQDQASQAPEGSDSAASADSPSAQEDSAESTDSSEGEKSSEDGSKDSEERRGEGGSRRRRRRGGRGRRGRGRGEDSTDADSAEDSERGARRGDEDEAGDKSSTSSDDSGKDKDAESSSGSGEGEKSSEGEESGSSSGGSRRRRRRRRSGSSDADSSSPDDPPNTVVKVREARDEVKSVKGSTRLEAKKQRRREGRDNGRKRNVITEAEFLARRESVKRSMIVRERPGRTQIAVLEDDVLVEHYVAQKSQTSMVGNVYLGKVQNVLPSMEAAFVDIGKGRNAVLYAGEVNWDAAGLEGQPRRIELALKSGDSVLVQVTKDPIGHKGARLTSQISLPGRYLVFVPGGSMTGISRKLPDTERSRLKKLMKQLIPEDAGVIVRTAAEGASEEELTRDVERLRAQWETIQKKQKSKSAPVALSQEPDLAIKVVRDVFNEDFTSLIVEGSSTYDELHQYISQVAPDLLERVTAHVGPKDSFAKYRIDEQLLKAMDRKVYLPSGGSLVIDRTEAMTVIDVNTGKFTGSGGSLEETVTKNNLESAEEIVRQLRLRDIGGIIVIDFIDMVLESNRDLVLRRLVECLGRDRTKHQVAEVTSLGLVQMTRKRVGQGLVETFSTTCEHCNGRGIITDMDGRTHNHDNDQMESKGSGESRSSKRRRKSKSKDKDGGKGRGGSGDDGESSTTPAAEDGSDVHRLDEDSRAQARATIASIAAASSAHASVDSADAQEDASERADASQGSQEPSEPAAQPAADGPEESSPAAESPEAPATEQ